MAEKILVTGAGGTVGRDIVRNLAAEGEQVVAAVHSPEKVDALGWPDGVEVDRFDWTDSSTWERVIPWVDRVMLIAPPLSPADTLMVPAADFFHREGVWKFVVLSVMGIEYAPEAPLRRVEVHLERTGTTNTFLRANWFMQNFGTMYRSMVVDRGEIALPAGAGETSFVDTRDVAASAAMALRYPDVHGNREYTLTGPEAFDHREVAEIISEVGGRSVEYVPVNDEEMIDRLVADGWPRGSAEFFVTLYEPVRAGQTAEVTDHIEQILNRPATTFRTWVRDAFGGDRG